MDGLVRAGPDLALREMRRFTRAALSDDPTSGLIGVLAGTGGRIASACEGLADLTERTRARIVDTVNRYAAQEEWYHPVADAVDLFVRFRPGTVIATAGDLYLMNLDLSAIHDDLPLTGELAVMVNGMGSTPLIELYVAFDAVQKYIASKGATIARSLVGNYITSLDMTGLSITVLRLTPYSPAICSIVAPSRRKRRKIPSTRDPSPANTASARANASRPMRVRSASGCSPLSSSVDPAFSTHARSRCIERRAPRCLSSMRLFAERIR